MDDMRSGVMRKLAARIDSYTSSEVILTYGLVWFI